MYNSTTSKKLINIIKEALKKDLRIKKLITINTTHNSIYEFTIVENDLDFGRDKIIDTLFDDFTQLTYYKKLDNGIIVILYQY